MSDTNDQQPYFCPVEGCEYGVHKEKSKASVKGHINSKSTDDHADVAALREAVEEQTDTDDRESTANGADTAESITDDPADTTPEAGAADGPNGGSTDDESDKTDMPTDDEYQRQQKAMDGTDTTTTDDPDETDRSTGDAGADTSGSTGDHGIGFPSVDRTTFLMLAAAAGVLVLLYVVLSGDNAEDVRDLDTTDEADDTTTDDTVDAGEIEGGLIAE